MENGLQDTLSQDPVKGVLLGPGCSMSEAYEHHTFKKTLTDSLIYEFDSLF